MEMCCHGSISFIYTLQHQKASNTKGFWEAMHRIDYKFILIPVFFLVLRIWSFVVDLLMVYIHIRNLNLVVLNFLIYTSVSVRT